MDTMFTLFIRFIFNEIIYFYTYIKSSILSLVQNLLDFAKASYFQCFDTLLDIFLKKTGLGRCLETVMDFLCDHWIKLIIVCTSILICIVRFKSRVKIKREPSKEKNRKMLEQTLKNVDKILKNQKVFGRDEQ